MLVGAVSCAAALGMLPVAGAAEASTPAPAALTTGYIVQAAAGHVSQAKRDVAALGGSVSIDLPIINGFSATLPADAAGLLARSADVLAVTADASTNLESAAYDPSTDVGSSAGLASDMGSSSYWAQHFTGQGIGVALIDSGVAPVPALAASGKVFYGPDFTPTGYFPQVRGLDTFGHGTFMAGLIAGQQPGATPDTANSGFLGVAPGAHIVSVKVADSSGATMQSAVIAGIQWVIQHRNDAGLNIKVLNLSLGVRNPLYTHDPLDAAAEAAWQAGITVVAAAGNDGNVGLMSPANDPHIIAVGALDAGATSSPDDDTPASFSNVGGRTRNPDLATIGTHVVSLRDPGSAIDQQYGAGAGSVDADLMRGSGTSQAAAITSGAVALLLSQRPNLTPDQVKGTLQASLRPLQHVSVRVVGGGALDMSSVLNGPTENGAPRDAWATVSVPATASAVLDATASTTPAGATWTGATWTGATWTGATWTGATWTGATWTGATWTGATWTGATWTGATWTGATWTGATWTGATWTGATWTGATWTTASWN